MVWCRAEPPLYPYPPLVAKNSWTVNTPAAPRFPLFKLAFPRPSDTTVPDSARVLPTALIPSTFASYTVE